MNAPLALLCLLIGTMLHFVMGFFMGAYDADRSNKVDAKDPGAKPVKHDGRRSLYRASIALTIALLVAWRAHGFGDVLTFTGAALCMFVGFFIATSPGVRLGFNLTRKVRGPAAVKGHWHLCYIAPWSNGYDRKILAAWVDFNGRGITQKFVDAMKADYPTGKWQALSIIHKSGRLAYWFEAVVLLLSVVGYAVILCR